MNSSSSNSKDVRRRTGPAARTRPADTPGGALERRVARLEFAEGALPRLRVPVAAVAAEAGRDVLTDIDVLSIDIDRRLRVSRSSAECKSGKGQKGEPYTIVWLAGFRELMQLSSVTIVRQTVSGRGRALARRLAIQALDEATIAARESSHQEFPMRFAHLDGERCQLAESETDRQLKDVGFPPDLARFLRAEALLSDSPSLLAAVQSYGQEARLRGGLPEPANSVMAGHSAMALALAALQDAGQLDDVPISDLRGRLTRALTVGDPDDEHLMPLLERADNLISYVIDRTHRAYVEAGSEPQQSETLSLRQIVSRPPDYLEDYLDVVTRLRSNPKVARDLLQTIEIACFEALLGGEHWDSRAFRHLFSPEHRGLFGVIVRCLRSVAGTEVADTLSPLAGMLREGTSGTARPHANISEDSASGEEALPQDQTVAQASLFDQRSEH